MRIIAGKFKNRRLNTFEISSTRPTSDLIRGAVFNSIGYKIEDALFLDLFAGSGAMGLEAISRNAKKSFFCDKNKQCTELIKNNAKLLNINNFEILNKDYLTALNHFKNIGIAFDIIYLDPPYMSNFAENAIKFVCENCLLKEDGLLLWEHDNSKNDTIKSLGLDSTKKYGSKFVSKFNYEQLNLLVQCINMQNNK